MRLARTAFIILTTACARAIAPAVTPAPPTALAVIPMRVEEEHAFVDVSINGVPVTLALDTGASASTLDGTWAAANISLAVSTTNRGTRAKVDSLRIGSVTLRDLSWGVQSFAAINASGMQRRPLAGVIGTDFYRRYVTEFDFAAGALRLYDPSRYTYSGNGVVVPVELRNNLPTTSVRIARTGQPPVSARLVLDAGAATAVSLSTEFYRETQLFDANAPSLRLYGITTVKGADSATVQRVGSVAFGALTIDSPPVTFSDALGRTLPMSIAEGLIGMPVMRRSRMIVDYARSRFIFEPDSSFSGPYPFQNVSGLSFRRRDGRLFIAHVIAGSPAADAGLRSGDEVLSVDDHQPPVTGPAFKAELEMPGTTHRIVYRRNAETMTVTLTLRRLI